MSADYISELHDEIRELKAIVIAFAWHKKDCTILTEEPIYRICNCGYEQALRKVKL